MIFCFCFFLFLNIYSSFYFLRAQKIRIFLRKFHLQNFCSLLFLGFFLSWLWHSYFCICWYKNHFLAYLLPFRTKSETFRIVLFLTISIFDKFQFSHFIFSKNKISKTKKKTKVDNKITIIRITNCHQRELILNKLAFTFVEKKQNIFGVMKIHGILFYLFKPNIIDWV